MFYLYKDEKGKNKYLCGLCEREFEANNSIPVCNDCSQVLKDFHNGKDLELAEKHVEMQKMSDEDFEEAQKRELAEYERQIDEVKRILKADLKPLTEGRGLTDYKEVAKRVTEYFSKTALSDDLDEVERLTAPAPTLAGLANALGVPIKVIHSYIDGEFADAEQMTIKRILEISLQMIVEYAEGKLYSHHFSGAKFHLSKLMPDVFGEEQVNNTLVINTITGEQAEKILRYVANKKQLNTPTAIEEGEDV